MKQTKLTNEYHGHNSAEFTHNNKFHRTSGEAFRDADYACAIERDRKAEEIKDMFEYAVLAIALISLYYAVKCIIM